MSKNMNPGHYHIIKGQMDKDQALMLHSASLLGTAAVYKSLGMTHEIRAMYQLELEYYLSAVRDGMNPKPKDQVMNLIYKAFEDNFERIAKMKEIGII